MKKQDHTELFSNKKFIFQFQSVETEQRTESTDLPNQNKEVSFNPNKEIELLCSTPSPELDKKINTYSLEQLEKIEKQAEIAQKLNIETKNALQKAIESKKTETQNLVQQTPDPLINMEKPQLQTDILKQKNETTDFKETPKPWTAAWNSFMTILGFGKNSHEDFDTDESPRFEETPQNPTEEKTSEETSAKEDKESTETLSDFKKLQNQINDQIQIHNADPKNTRIQINSNLDGKPNTLNLIENTDNHKICTNIKNLIEQQNISERQSQPQNISKIILQKNLLPQTLSQIWDNKNLFQNQNLETFSWTDKNVSDFIEQAQKTSQSAELEKKETNALPQEKSQKTNPDTTKDLFNSPIINKTANTHPEESNREQESSEIAFTNSKEKILSRFSYFGVLPSLVEEIQSLDFSKENEQKLKDLDTLIQRLELPMTDPKRNKLLEVLQDSDNPQNATIKSLLQIPQWEKLIPTWNTENSEKSLGIPDLNSTQIDALLQILSGPENKISPERIKQLNLPTQNEYGDSYNYNSSEITSYLVKSLSPQQIQTYAESARNEWLISHSKDTFNPEFFEQVENNFFQNKNISQETKAEYAKKGIQKIQEIPLDIFLESRLKNYAISVLQNTADSAQRSEYAQEQIKEIKENIEKTKVKFEKTENEIQQLDKTLRNILEKKYGTIQSNQSICKELYRAQKVGIYTEIPFKTKSGEIKNINIEKDIKSLNKSDTYYEATNIARRSETLKTALLDHATTIEITNALITPNTYPELQTLTPADIRSEIFRWTEKARYNENNTFKGSPYLGKIPKAIYNKVQFPLNKIES